MEILKQLIFLCLAAAVIVGAVRFFLLSGIEHICNVLHYSAKVKGQLIGYATSLPELVVILTSAWAGVISAGFWNVASSNIINCVLFFIAIFYFRQSHELKALRFIDEVLAAILSVILPLLLFGLGFSLNITVALLLVGIFILYKVLDIVLNRTDKTTNREEDNTTEGSLKRGILLLLLGITCVLMGGKFLGDAAENLIAQLNIPGWMVGWLLGLITSVPEMTSFFEIYRREKAAGRQQNTHDTQQALDALVASNMCNLGIILPCGTLLFLLLHG